MINESERYTENANVLKNKVDPNILIHIYGNLLISNWQNVDHKNIY